MKKSLLSIALIAIVFSVNAQKVTYGATAGFHNLVAKASGTAKNTTVSTSNDASGLFVGMFADIQLSEKFYVKPELQYAITFKDGDNFSELILPIMAKYYVDKKFNIQAGPLLDFILDNVSPNTNKFGLGIAAGLGYDFTKKIFATARYSFGLTNRTDDLPSGVSLKTKVFQIGLGYRF